MQRQWYLLIGSLIVMGALYNHYLGHSVLSVEIVMLAVGAVLALVSLRGLAKEHAPTSNDGILVVWLTRFINEKTLRTVLPLFGFVLLISWSSWKLFVNGETNLQMEDIIVTLFALSLTVYYSGPSWFQNEKDFAVLYLMFLTIVFVVIWNLYELISGESYSNVNAHTEFYFVTMPTVFLLNLFGVDATAILNTEGFGLSNMIMFEWDGREILLGIGAGCSGLYSAGLFFSAFLGFVIVRYRSFDKWIFVGLCLGLALTWASNIIRMVVTVTVGSIYGPPALATFHMYFGILLFIVVITIFWALIVRWLDIHEKVYAGPGKVSDVQAEHPLKAEPGTSGDMTNT